MSALREAAQQALEALESALEIMRADWHAIDNEFGPSEGGLEAAIDGRLSGYEYFQETITAITALRAALAQEQAEPVAWVSKRALARIKDFDSTIYANGGFDDAVPLYTAPPQRLPLSGLEVERLLEQVIGSLPAARNLVRAVERAHGIIGSEIKGDSHQTLDDAMQQPRAMAQAYERGYKAGAAAEREAIIQTIPGGHIVDPQWVCDIIRARSNT